MEDPPYIDDEDWPAFVGPPPFQVWEGDWRSDDMDVAVGKFMCALPLFEVMLMLTRDDVAPSDSWVDVDEQGPTTAMRIIYAHLQDFPERDRGMLMLYLGQAPPCSRPSTSRDAREVDRSRSGEPHGDQRATDASQGRQADDRCCPPAWL